MSAATATFTFDPLAPLLPLLAAGDREAMPQIAKRFTPLIRRIAQRRGAGGGQDDVVQETLLRLWRSAGRFDPERGTEQAFDLLPAWRSRVKAQSQQILQGHRRCRSGKASVSQPHPRRTDPGAGRVIAIPPRRTPLR